MARSRSLIRALTFALASASLLTSISLAQTPADRSAGDYRVGIEDQLGVVVWGEPGLSLSVRVRPDGKITLPLINDIAVAGNTPEQIREAIGKRLSEYIRDPSVTVIVEQGNSFRVYFLGEIRNQGAVQFHSPTRLLQAMATAGGLTEFSKKEVTLLRRVGDSERRISIDYKKLFSGDSSQENIWLKPGDTLLFP